MGDCGPRADGQPRKTNASAIWFVYRDVSLIFWQLRVHEAVIRDLYRLYIKSHLRFSDGFLKTKTMRSGSSGFLNLVSKSSLTIHLRDAWRCRGTFS
jgi:hypothetical protein